MTDKSCTELLVNVQLRHFLNNYIIKCDVQVSIYFWLRIHTAYLLENKSSHLFYFNKNRCQFFYVI